MEYRKKSAPYGSAQSVRPGVMGLANAPGCFLAYYSFYHVLLVHFSSNRVELLLLRVYGRGYIGCKNSERTSI